VLNGLSIERALPADGPRAAFEHETLRLAVTAVLGQGATMPGPMDDRPPRQYR
jgi:hypothetical protein